MIGELARVYDLQNNAQYRDDMTFAEAETGIRTSLSWLLPRSAADLRRKRRNSELWNRFTWGQLWRSPDVRPAPELAPREAVPQLAVAALAPEVGGRAREQPGQAGAYPGFRFGEGHVVAVLGIVLQVIDARQFPDHEFEGRVRGDVQRVRRRTRFRDRPSGSARTARRSSRPVPSAGGVSLPCRSSPLGSTHLLVGQDANARRLP